MAATSFYSPNLKSILNGLLQSHIPTTYALHRNDPLYADYRSKLTPQVCYNQIRVNTSQAYTDTHIPMNLGPYVIGHIVHNSKMRAVRDLTFEVILLLML